MSQPSRRLVLARALSDIEELKEMLNQDQQPGRRIQPTELRPITKATGGKTIRTVINSYIAKVGLQGFKESDPKFIDRFFVACCNRLGIAIDIIIGAIREVLLANDAELTDTGAAILSNRQVSKGGQRCTRLCGIQLTGNAP